MSLKITPSDGNFDIFFWVLANRTCRRILKLLTLFRKMNISSIALQLNQTEASVSYQVKRLEKTGLLKLEFKPGKHGVNKNISLAYSHISINFSESEINTKRDAI